MTNLNRQILHTARRVGVNKAKSGMITVREHNPNVRVTAIEERITEENVDGPGR